MVDMRRWILQCFVMMLPFSVYSQKQDYVWVLGGSYERTVLDFKDNMEMTRLDFISPYLIGSDVTSISTAEGDLLFYANGCTLFRKDHKPMPDGDSLTAPGWQYDEFCTGDYIGFNYHSNSIILPDPGNQQGYYYLTKMQDIDFENEIYLSDFRYSYVDFSEDAYGAVKEKNVEVLPVSVYMSNYVDACQHENGRDWWTIQGREGINEFYKILVDTSGVHVVDTFSIGSEEDYWITGGQCSYSPSGDMLASYNDNGLMLYDFDRSTGDLSNFRSYKSLPTSGGSLGLAFSPSGRFIYCGSKHGLYQVDLWHEGADDFIVLVDTVDQKAEYPFNSSFSIMALAPDCKIYIAFGNGIFYWHVIHRPDEKGTACNLEQGVRLPFNNGIRTMPNHPNFRIDEDAVCDSTLTSIVDILRIDGEKISVYPNPAKTTIHLTAPVTGYRLYDLSGTLLLRDGGYLLQEIDISTLRMGLYILQVRDVHGRLQHIKVVKG